MNEGFRETLQQVFDQKKLGNPAYSLNAFARDLDLYPSHLHDILHGKKGLSAKAAKKIAARLFDDEKERRLFVDRVMAVCSRGQSEKAQARRRLVDQHQIVHEELSAEMFNIVKDWYHFALREYVLVRGPKFKLEEAAKYLDVPVKNLKEALESMEKAGFMKRNRAGRWTTSEPIINAPVGVPGAAKKMHHLQLMEIAKQAYLKHEYERKIFLSAILAIDSSKLPLANKLVREFHESMNKLLTSDKAKRDQVYCFVTQLYSLENGGVISP